MRYIIASGHRETLYSLGAAPAARLSEMAGAAAAARAPRWARNAIIAMSSLVLIFIRKSCWRALRHSRVAAAASEIAIFSKLALLPPHVAAWKHAAISASKIRINHRKCRVAMLARQ